MTANWVRRFFPTRPNAEAVRKPLPGPRLLVELLEDRSTPSTFNVLNLADSGAGSLRQAVLDANAHSGADTILFQVTGIINLTSGQLNITDHLTVDGPGAAALRIAGTGGNSGQRLFVLTSGVTATLEGMTLADSHIPFAQGSAIRFQNGAAIYNQGTLTLSNSILSDNGVDIEGSGGAIYNTGKLTISICTLSGNRAGFDGGAIWNSGTLLVKDSTLSDNIADEFGGGILNLGGAVTITHSVVTRNEARDDNGGAINNVGTLGTLVISSSTISDNKAASSGGGILNTGSLKVSNSTLSGNEARDSGGAIFNTGSATISASTLSHNSARAQGPLGDGGGAIYTRGTLTLSKSLVTDNVVGPANDPTGTGAGGGVWNNGTLTVSETTVARNKAWEGGAFANYHSLKVNKSTIADNDARLAAGIANAGTLTVTLSTFSGNGSRGTDNGGAILNKGTATISSSTLTRNFAEFDGGGIYNAGGRVTVKQSTLANNTAREFGGGINNQLAGTLVVSSSTFSGNEGSFDGGAIHNAGRLTMTNSTLSGNKSEEGGGLATHFGTVTIYDSTITANRVRFSGGGIRIVGGTVTLFNTLAAANTSGCQPLFPGGPCDWSIPGTVRDDVSGPISSSSRNNLIGDGTGMTGLTNGVGGNQIGSSAAPIDPHLGPLANNGGPTQTHALFSGSPAIDAGLNSKIPSGVTTDQRGLPRIVNGKVDIGAFERSAPVTIDFSTHGEGPLAADFYKSAGVIFTEGNFVGFVQGDEALVPGPVAGTFTQPISALSVRVAPAFQGTAEYTLTAFDDGGNVVGTKSLTVSQDIGDPATGPAGYFTIELGSLSGPASSFRLVNKFVRSSFPQFATIEFGVGSLTFAGC